ncbi:MAG TPA: M61 family peptidase, partial [Candidatus Eisenbacteria bacterium]|nr:M61 family peptidase [Candidatus Eisenbacteria bacterium]
MSPRAILVLGIVLVALATSAPAISAPRAVGGADAIHLFVDATEAPRGIVHSRLEIPVKPGPLTLYYPKWIPGEHAPSGPIAELAGLRLTADGQTVPWERDPLDMFAIHCTIPRGVARLEVACEALQSGKGAFTSGGSSTGSLAVLNWNQLLVYPAVEATDRLTVSARLRLPAGWKYGTALDTRSESGGEIVFAPVSLTTLVDSPLIAGAHHRRIDLSPGETPAHVIDIVCDSEEGLAVGDETVASWRRLVTEAGDLFGARHYRRYNFLLTLSDHVAHFGLEHHESSDNRLGEYALVNEAIRKSSSGLLPHEFVHSWIGKYRRPAGLCRSNFQKPMQTELLWVYEGLTSYLEWVLTSRSGLVTPGWQREDLASTAAWLDRRPGRAWRPLKDTAVGAQFLYGSPGAWSSLRRSVDFYGEGTLIWLDADVLIRRESGGKRSLDDFCRIFAGGESGAPKVAPHTLDDVVSGLNRVVPYDWRGFLAERIDAPSAHAPLGGITTGGWRLAYADSLTPALKAYEESSESVYESYSLGINLNKDAILTDVIVDSPGAKAGLAPGMKVLSVNGRRYSGKHLREELRAAKGKPEPFEVIAEQGDFVRVYRLDWNGGPVYPVL